MKIGSREFTWGERTFVMGIVNVTPDSFSDGGAFTDARGAVDHALALIDQGADLIDIGGESTRPGAAEVTEREELARVLPVFEALRKAAPLFPLSIDTMKAGVAKAAIEAGAVLVNDVTGLRDPAMAALVRSTGVAGCVMHMRGTPKTMEGLARYDDIVAEVMAELRVAIDGSGVDRARLLVDPGIGFAKTLEHNLSLLKHGAALRALGCPIVLGTSRKGFLGALSGVKNANERLIPSIASIASAAALGGADIVRVHDVAATKQALSVADAIRRAQ